MNLSLLYKYPCVVFAFALTCAVVFIFGTWRYGFSDFVLWGAAVALLAVALFPLQRKHESYGVAQRKTLLGLAKDPVIYIGVLLLAYMALQALNCGRPLMYNVTAGRWMHGAPPWPGVPSSVNAGAVWRMFFSFAPAVAILLCIRHGMTSAGRRAFLALLVVLSALVAVWEFAGFLWLGGQTDDWRIFSNADHEGIWFLFCFCVAFVLWGNGCLRKFPVWLCRLFFACALLDLAGILVIRAPTALLLVWCAGLPLAVATLAVVWPVIGYPRRMASMAVLGGLLLLAFFLFARNGLNFLGLGLSTAGKGTLSQMVFDGRAERLEVAWKIAKDNLMFGAGAGNYPFFSELYWPAKRIADFPLQGLAASNDFAQMFAEFGIVGLLIMLAMAVFFVPPLLRRWPGSPPARRRLFVVFVAGVGLVFVAAWVESPFRSPPVLVSVVAALACASGFLLNPQREDDLI